MPREPANLKGAAACRPHRGAGRDAPTLSGRAPGTTGPQPRSAAATEGAPVAPAAEAGPRGLNPPPVPELLTPVAVAAAAVLAACVYVCVCCGGATKGEKLGMVNSSRLLVTAQQPCRSTPTRTHAAALSSPHGSLRCSPSHHLVVAEHLLQSVVDCEGGGHRDRPLDPVHRHPLVQPSHSLAPEQRARKFVHVHFV